MKTYHVGLKRQGTTAIFEFADSVDQLSCETLKYFGEREIQNFAKHRRQISKLEIKRAVLKQLEIDYPGMFQSVRVERVLPGDFMAEHRNTSDYEIAEFFAQL